MIVSRYGVTLSSNRSGIPRDLFVQSKGVVLMSVIEAGFVFSGSVGTGVLIGEFLQ